MEDLRDGGTPHRVKFILIANTEKQSTEMINLMRQSFKKKKWVQLIDTINQSDEKWSVWHQRLFTAEEMEGRGPMLWVPTS